MTLHDRGPFDPRPQSSAALLIVIACSAMAWCAIIACAALLVQVVWR